MQIIPSGEAKSNQMQCEIVLCLIRIRCLVNQEPHFTLCDTLRSRFPVLVSVQYLPTWRFAKLGRKKINWPFCGLLGRITSIDTLRYAWALLSIRTYVNVLFIYWIGNVGCCLFVINMYGIVGTGTALCGMEM